MQDQRRYALVWQIHHDNVVAALRPLILAHGPLRASYVAANVVALGIVAWAWRRSGLGAFEAFSNVCAGMVLGYLALLPVHEQIHAWLHCWLGADQQQVHVEYRWRALTAFCVADRFVMDGAGLLLVALGPFAVLNPPMALAAILAPGRVGVLLAGALLLHVGACSGDFALANWARRREHGKTLYTYDDVAARTSYFFVPRESTSSFG